MGLKSMIIDQQSERIRIKDIADIAGVSAGTVDRVLHGRPNVSESSRAKVERVLKEIDFQPNVYASALASNKKYKFACLLPQYNEGDYWSDVELGIKRAVDRYSDLQISLKIVHYDPFDHSSFQKGGLRLLAEEPDGMMLSPIVKDATEEIVLELQKKEVPYVFIDSTITELSPLAFYGQNSMKSGYFAAKMLLLLNSQPEEELVIFRQSFKGKVGSNQQRTREIGFRKCLTEYRPTLKIHELDLQAKHPAEDHQLLNDFFEQHPKAKLGITFNSRVYIIGEYLEENSIKDFKLIGYDLLSRNIGCVKRGSVNFLIAQHPWLQGFNGIKALCDHLIFKKEVIQNNYMPIELLSSDNIDFYLRTQQ